MNIAIIQSAWTVIVAIFFVGVVIWAWSGRQKAEFDQAAQLPFTEDDDLSPQHSKEG